MVNAQTGPGGVNDLTGTSNLELWLQADSITGVADGAAIAEWPDASGNNFNATSTSINQPTFLGNTVNGLPVVRFEGDDFFDDTHAYSGNYLFIVYNFRTSLQGTDDLGQLWGAYEDGAHVAIDTRTGNQDGFSFDGRNSDVNQGSYNFNAAAFGTAISNGNAIPTNFDQFDILTVEFNASRAVTRQIIGTLDTASFDIATHNFDGDIAEIIVFSDVLNTAERLAVENYLSSKYNITLTQNDFYEFDSSHGNQVAGIGRVDVSNTQLVANSSSVLQVSNPSDLGDGEYLFFGHDNQSIGTWVEAEIPSEVDSIQRISREWRLNETLDVGTVTFTIDTSLFENRPQGFLNFVLLTDADGDFTEGASVYELTSPGTNNLFEVAIDVSDGLYVSVGTIMPSLQFTNPLENGFESSTVNVSVELNYISANSVTFTYDTEDITATAGIEYTALTSEIGTILAGNQTTTIPVDLLSTSGDKSFALKLSSPSEGELGENDSLTYFINDLDETGEVSFVTTTASGSETTAIVPVSIQVNAINPSNDIEVVYTVTGGTAASTLDFESIELDTVTIPSGATQGVFFLNVLDDPDEESNETIIISILSASNARLSASGVDFTYTIVNDDNLPSVQFSGTSGSGVESTSPVTLTVELSKANLNAVSIDYSVSGTGTGDADFVLSDGSLVIAASQLSNTISLPIINDANSESSETVVVSIVSSSNYTLGADSIFTYTITDDDPFGTTGPGGVGDASINRLWLRADIISGVADGADIASWPDFSGNSNDAAQTSSASLNNSISFPSFEDNQINGQPVVRFDHTVNDALIDDYTYPGRTIYSVFRATSAFDNANSDLGQIWGNYEDQIHIALEARNGGNSNGYSFDGDAGSSSTGAIYGLDGAVFSTTFDLNNNSQPWTADQTHLLSVEFDEERTVNRQVIGSLEPDLGNFGLGADIGEIIVFNTTLGDARQNIVENYLSSKYAITLADDDLYAYDAISTHENDVSGIGQQSANDFHLSAQSSGILTVTADNLEDGEYLLFGHNGGDTSAWSVALVPDASFQSLQRIWRFDATGTFNAVDLAFDTQNLPSLPANFSSYYLFIDDDGDLTNGVASISLLEVSGTNRVANGVTIADGQYVTVGIRNDILLNFTDATSSVNESTATLNVAVNLSQAVGSDVTVAFAVTGGSATGGGTDYSLASGTLTFTSGAMSPADTVQTFDITINTADTEIELDESIIVSLQNPTTGALGADSVLTVTIVNDDNSGFTGPGGVGNSANNALWLRATDLNLTDGGTVNTAWLDQSGNGRDAAVFGDPTFRTTGINSQPSVEFDGVGDYFFDADGNYMNESFGFAMFSLIQSNDAATDNGFFNTEVPDGGDDVLAFRYDVDGGDGDFNLMKAGIDTDAGGRVVETAANSQTTSPQMVAFYWSGDTLGVRLDGNFDMSSEPSTSVGGEIENSDEIYVGQGPKDNLATGGWDGDIGEFILYNQGLNLTQLNIIENYLGAKYQLGTLGNDKYAHQTVHGFGVAGIGRESTADFHVKAMSDSLMIVSNASGLDDGEYLLFGHDNGAFNTWQTTDVPGNNFSRIQREWRIDETGGDSDLGNILIALDTTQLAANPVEQSLYAMMYDADGDFANGAMVVPLVKSLSEPTYRLQETTNVPDDSYISFGVYQSFVNYEDTILSVTEDVGEVTVVVNLNYPLTTDATINYQVLGSSSAIFNTDHNLSDGALVITAGNTTDSITFNVLADMIEEAIDTLIIQLQSVTTGTIGSDDTFTLIINDDDSDVDVDFTIASSSGGEASSPANITIRLSETSVSDVEVLYEVTGGSATATEDFTLVADTATIVAGNLSTNLTVAINDDILGEVDETIEITLSNPSNANIGANNLHTYTIIDDDDDLTIQFADTVAGASEAAGTANVELVLTAVAGSDLSVDFAVIGGTATGTGQDYTLLDGTLTISSGNDRGVLAIALTDDALVEGGETIVIQLSNPGAGLILGADSIVTFTIADNDNNGFSGPGGVGNSTNNQLWLRAQDFAVSDATTVATDWNDYSGNNHDAAVNGDPTYRVAGINSRPSIDFDGVGDYFLDADGDFLNNSAGYNIFMLVQSNNSDTDKGIFDTQTPSDGDDVVALRYDAGGTSGGGDQVLKSGLDATLGSIQYESATGTQTTDPQLIGMSWAGATIEMRFNGTGDVATFASSTSGFVENSDMFYIGAGPKDNNLATEGWDGDIAEFIVYDQPLNTAQVVIVENYLANKYGIIIANDYYSLQSSYGEDIAGFGREDASNLHAGAQSDSLLTISNASSLDIGDYAFFGHDGGVISSWTSNDLPNNNLRRVAREWRIDYDQTGDGSIGTVTVEIDTTRLPARPDGFTDFFLLTDDDGIFNSGGTIVSLTDNGDNTFTANGVILADNDFFTIATGSQSIAFDTAAVALAEPNGPAILTVTSAFEAADSITVTYTVDAGSTATGAGTDYSLSATGTIVITPGNNSANLTIPIVNDSESESDETIIINLSNPINAVLGANTTSTASISDDDNLRTIQFNASSDMQDESVDSTAFIVQVNFADNTNPTTVEYTLTGTATNGNTDYLISPSSGTLTVPATQTTDTLFVTINEDGLFENDETFIVTLSSPTNAGLGSNSVFTYTITDNDTEPTVQFTSTTTSSSEAINPGTLEVSLSDFSGKSVVVDYTVAAGTATGGVDYILNSGSVTIPAGALVANIETAIIQDNEIEGAETYQVTITGASGAAISGNLVNEVTIVDDDNEGFTGPGGVGDAGNNAVWLRPDLGVLDVSSMELSEGQNLVTWADQSGNSNDFTITTGDNPIFRSTGINSNPSVEFDGANDFVEDSDGESYLNGSANLTYFTVIQSNLADGTDAGWFASENPATDGSGDGKISIRYDNGGASGLQDNVLKAGVTATSGEQAVETSANSQTTNPQLVTYEWNSGSNLNIYLDGTVEVLSNAGAGAQSGVVNDALTAILGKGGLDNGSNEGWAGDIGEFILYNQQINTTQRIIVENYLSSKFQLTIANDLYTYDGNGQYENDVVGIGQQAGDNNHTKSQSAGLLSIGNPTALATGDYLFMGHNDADTTSWTIADAPNGGANIRRIAREWRLDETVDVGNVTFSFDTSALPVRPIGFDQYYLLVDADGSFASGASLHETILAGDEYQTSGLDITDGSYVTLAVIRNDIQFTAGSSSEFEPDGPANIGVSASFPVGQDVTISYIVTDGTATFGSDHNLASGTATITKGNSTTSIALPLINDSNVESNENLTITINDVTDGFEIGSNNVHTFTINDDDEPRKIFFDNTFAVGRADSTGAAENVSPLPAGSDVLRVAITTGEQDASNVTTVDLQVKPGGTATEGVDFTLNQTTATVAVNTLFIDLSNAITIIDDALFEGNETFTIELVNPTNSNLDDPATNPIELQYTIEDNDSEPTVQFTNATASVDEGAGTLNVEVSLSAVSVDDVTVTIGLSGGTASESADFALNTTALNILAGSTTGNAIISLVDDSDVEGQETIILLMSSPVNATISGNSSVTITLNDNDNNGIIGPGGVGNSTNNALWLRASDFSLSDGAAATAWLDQSGNSRDAAVNGNPIYRASGINGTPSIDFDGTGDYFLDADGSYMNTSTGMAMFAIVQSDNATTDKGFFLTEVPDGGDAQLGFRYDVDGGEGDLNVMKLAIDTDDASTAYESANATQSTSPQILSYYWSGTNLNLNINGTMDVPSEASASVGGAIENSNAIYIGQGSKDNLTTGGWDGDIGEFILYNQALNVAQIRIVENYLSAKFGTTIANDVYAENQTDSYENEVAGIGQLSGVSHIAAQSGGMLTVSNPSALGDNDFLLFGHNGADTTTWTTTQSPTATQRLARQWYFDETNDVGTISISIADSSLLPTLPTGFNNLVLLSASGEDLSSATINNLINVGGNEFQAINFDPLGQWVAIGVLENVSNGTNGDWSLTTTWAAGVVPGAGETANITAGDDVFLSTDVTIGSVVIETGATLDLDAFTLTVDEGTLALEGTGTVITGTSTVQYSAAAPQDVAVGFTYNNLTLAGTGTKTLTGNMDVNGDLLISNSLDASASNFNINVGGDFDNQGTYNPRNGTVVMDGTGDQQLSGTLNLYALTINNSGGDVNLDDEVNLDGDLTLSAGNLVLGNRNLTLSTTSSIGGGSASSFIQADGTGNINKSIGSVPFGGYFKFPIGDVSGDYSPFYFNLNTATLGASPSIAINVDNFRNTNLRSDAAHIIRFWTLEPTDLSGTIDYDIAYIYVPTDVVSDEPFLVPIKFSTDVDTSGYTSGVDYDLDVALDSIYWNGLTSFSEVTAGLDEDNNAVLPVELLYFEGVEEEIGFLLKWATATEKENDYFVIEHSYDGLQFVAIGEMDGHGTSKIKREYEYLDDSPPAGLSYYRLRQVDFDGASEFSRIVAFEYLPKEIPLQVIVSPNPFIDQLTLKLNYALPGMKLEIHNLSGNRQLKTKLGSGTTHQLDLRELRSGIYQVTLTTPQGKVYKRIIKL